VRLDVNRQPHEVDPSPSRSLATVLRDELGLTGTKVACGEGECGACTVLVDGRARPSCRLAVAEAAGAQVTTIEGLAAGGDLHPVQRAFLDAGAFQCGYCTPGMILAAVSLLAAEPDPSEERIRGALERHLCRCGAYPRIIQAIRAAVRR
jgi:aerobic-type carbon monoxide dehydrogenase small subunit (CoxS/CutS family)